VITTGVILLILGALLGIGVLTTIGVIMAVVGAALAILSETTNALSGQ